MQIKSTEPFELFAFESEDGRSQIREWLSSIRGTSIQKAVEGRIRRVSRGNLGDVKQFRFASRRRPVLLELRINVRSGPRLYALAAGGRRLVLLSGGTKDGSHERFRAPPRMRRAQRPNSGAVAPRRSADRAKG